MRLEQSRTIFATLLFAAMIVSITDRVASAAPDAELLKLAEGEFSNLTPAETALLKFAGSYRSEPGGFAIAGTSANPDDPSNDSAHADKWGKEREARACVWRIANSDTGRSRSADLRIGGRALNSDAA